MARKKTTKPEGKQELLLHLKSVVRLPDGTDVYPGANQVSPECIEMVRTNPLMKKWLAKGLISIRENVPEPGSVEYDLDALGLPRSLLGLDLDTVKQAIKMCTNRDTIVQWLNDAGNPQVRSMLIDRSYEIAQEQAQKPAAQQAIH